MLTVALALIANGHSWILPLPMLYHILQLIAEIADELKAKQVSIKSNLERLPRREQVVKTFKTRIQIYPKLSVSKYAINQSWPL